jgi:hypothetical protein
MSTSRRSFDPPVHGCHAFAIDPELFQKYATWKASQNVEVAALDVIQGQAILVWYRETDD